MSIEIIVICVLSAIAAALSVYAFVKSRNNADAELSKQQLDLLNQENEQLKRLNIETSKEVEHLQNNANDAQKQIQELQNELKGVRTEKDNAEKKLSAVEKELEIQRENSNKEREKEQETRKKQDELLKEQFQNLANSILKQQSQEFNEKNKESLEMLLKPFKDNISDFKKRVEEIYTDENKQRGALQNQLESLMKMNANISEDAKNLTSALKGQSKVQGDWGEAVLNTILESTLTRGQNYEIQFVTKEEQEDGSSRNKRPDAVVYLPEDKVIVLDAKTSLTDYIRYTEAKTSEESKAALDAHIKSVRKHVEELSRKDYRESVCDELNKKGKSRVSPDFVIMFISNEPAFLEALKADSQIWADAYKRGVIIASPTNLYAILKVVDNMWKSYDLDKRSAQIVTLASDLYDRTRLFVKDFNDMGVALRKAGEQYKNASKRLTAESGKISIVRVGENLRRMLPTDAQPLPLQQYEDFGIGHNEDSADE